MAGNVIGEAFGKVRERLRNVEANERAELAGHAVTSDSSTSATTASQVPAYTFAGLPTPGTPGRHAFVTDGRKIGEGAGLGTGVVAYDDGAGWYRASDDSVVAN